jgi:uncharacterized protein
LTHSGPRARGVFDAGGGIDQRPRRDGKYLESSMVPVTSLYAALAVLLVLVLVARVVQRRRAARIGLGDGGDAELARRIRAHANAIETLPLGLLLLALLELGGTAVLLLHALGATLLIGRILHAWGISGTAGVSFGRFHGMLLTLLALLAMALLLVWRAVAG